MDGWTDRWMNGWMDEWMDKWMDSQAYGQTFEHIQLSNNYLIVFSETLIQLFTGCQYIQRRVLVNQQSLWKITCHLGNYINNIYQLLHSLYTTSNVDNIHNIIVVSLLFFAQI